VSTSPTRRTDAGARELLLALVTVLRRIKPKTGDGRVEPSAFYVLHQVRADADGPRLSELAKCMNLDASTVSRHIRQLEIAGYVSRTTDPDDGRAFRVRLTDEGHSLLDTALELQVSLLDRAIAEWPEADRDTLITLVTRLAESVDRQAAGTELSR
jgi:DNA-binding MarR family transcriptional regulator